MCRLICTNNANVPADLQSAGIKYKDFQSACFLLLIYRYVFRIADPDTLCCRIAYPPEHYSCCFSTIPYKRHNTNKTNVPADLHELLSVAKNLPEYSIRIFNPLASYL